MKIIDKLSSNLFTIQCGCGKVFDHNSRQDKIYCISCGLWGSLEELRKNEATKEGWEEEYKGNGLRKEE